VERQTVVHVAKSLSKLIITGYGVSGALRCVCFAGEGNGPGGGGN
jgi:uncharacterized protein YodC (DUF2158 family)